jgi:hypothetical protein
VPDPAKRAATTSIRQDPAEDQSIEAFSRRLWPWRERRLLGLVAAAAVLDYFSTYAALEISGKEGIHEIGLLGSWALEAGGFTGLLLANACALTALSLAAAAARMLCRRHGFTGAGRAAFIVLLLPYVLAASAAATWNLIAGFA